MAAKASVSLSKESSSCPVGGMVAWGGGDAFGGGGGGCRRVPVDGVSQQVGAGKKGRRRRRGRGAFNLECDTRKILNINQNKIHHWYR